MNKVAILAFPSVKYDIIMGIIKLGDIFDKEEKGHGYSGIL